MILKWDLTSQVDKINLAKVGIEFQKDNLFYENINLIAATNENGQQIFPFKPLSKELNLHKHDLFERNFRLSAYIQDKIEFESLIINVGLRFDMFNPQGKVPTDLEDPNIYNPFKLEHIYQDLNNDGLIGIDEQTDLNKLSLIERESFWYTKPKLKQD